MGQITLEGVSKSFGATAVIRDIDLSIADGEFCVFVGPSGCGKSTLLRMIAGLEAPGAGRILIDGQDVTAVEPYDRGLSMVFQSYALYPHMTVRDNIAFALRTARMPAAQIAARVETAARMLQLGPYLDRKPAALSGGQRQRVAIGRAIVRDPKAFLFDEPLSNLDAELRVHMRIEIARLHRELNATIVYVTHDQVEAMTLAHKIVVLREGRVEQVGAPLTLYDDPDNQFVAGFIGSPRMNLLAAVRRGDRLALTDFPGQSLSLPPLARPPAEGAAVTVGLRPDAFRRGGGEALDLTVEIVEHLGSETLIHGRQDAGGEIVTISTDDGREVVAGQPLRARFAPEAMRLFDRSGARIR